MHKKILYILPVFLAACSPAVSTYTELAPSKPVTLLSPTISVTSTLAPRQTIEPVESLLDSQGPWIFAYNEYSRNPPYFLNLNGTGYFALETQPASIMFNRCGNASNASTSNRYKAHCFQESGKFELQISNLSDGTLLRRIPLIGEQAHQVIKDYIPPTENFDNPPFPPVTFSVGYYLWSPDGNYLAFVGAIDGPSGDVYVYEPDQDRIRRLNSGPEEVKIMGWSPDSLNVLYVTGSEYDIFNSLVGDEVQIVDMNGKIASLYSLSMNGSFAPIISGWIDEDTFISLRPTFEGNPIDLLLVNIESKEITPIDAPNFRKVLYDSRRQRLLINWGRTARGFADGVYEYDLSTGELNDFAVDMGVEEILLLVPYYFAEGESSYLLVDESGNIVSELNCQQSEPKVSPDGRFILKPGAESILLTDLEMTTIRKLDDVILAQWLPDASGFYGYTGEYDLYGINTFQVVLYTEENDWQPVLVNTLSIYGCFTFVQP